MFSLKGSLSPGGRGSGRGGRLRAALTAVSVALLAGYFVLVLLQVFFRYVLNESLFWAEELVRGAMLWGIMLSSALVAASRGHIRVEVLELMLPPGGRRMVVWTANALTLAFSLILLWAGIQFIDRTWMQQSPVLDVPKWTVYLAIPVGAALESLLMILTWNHEHSVADELTDRTL
jgi:TRAP-type transport system small permease protein